MDNALFSDFLYLSDYGKRWGGQPGDCPVTEDVSDRLLRLPFYNELDETEQGRFIEAVPEFRVSSEN